MNPPPGGWDGLACLAALGWGVVQLPSPDYPAELTGPLLEQVAEHAQEFVDHGYAVVVLGPCPGLEEALARVGVAHLPTCRASTPADVERFLSLVDARSAPRQPG